jgi:hypothetical protein
VIGIGAFASCSPYDPTLGPEPFFCGSADPKCPDGYTCMAAGSGSGSSVCAMMVPTGGANCKNAFTGVLATWDFTGQPGSQVSTAAKSTASGVTAGMASRSATLMPSSGTNSINSSNWPTAAQRDMNTYYTLSITPPSGCSVSMSTIAVDVASSSTGPTVAAVATSADAFAQTGPISTATPSTPTLSVSKSATAVELRVYGFSAAAMDGTMRLQNMVTVTGSIQ